MLYQFNQLFEYFKNWINIQNTSQKHKKLNGQKNLRFFFDSTKNEKIL